MQETLKHNYEDPLHSNKMKINLEQHTQNYPLKLTSVWKDSLQYNLNMHKNWGSAEEERKNSEEVTNYTTCPMSDYCTMNSKSNSVMRYLLT